MGVFGVKGAGLQPCSSGEARVGAELHSAELEQSCTLLLNVTKRSATPLQR